MFAIRVDILYSKVVEDVWRIIPSPSLFDNTLHTYTRMLHAIKPPKWCSQPSPMEPILVIRNKTAIGRRRLVGYFCWVTFEFDIDRSVATIADIEQCWQDCQKRLLICRICAKNMSHEWHKLFCKYWYPVQIWKSPLLCTALSVCFSTHVCRVWHPHNSTSKAFVLNRIAANI